MRKEQIFFADFETVTKDTIYFQKNNDTRVLLWVIKRLDGSCEKLGTNLKTFFDYFINFPKKTRKFFCYFHNLNWDGDFILKWLAKNGFEFMNLFEWEDNATINRFTFIRQSRQIYQIKVCLKNKNDVKIELVFMCSYKLLSSGVEALGKSIGISKHNEKTLDSSFYNQEPKNNIEEYDQDFVEYAKRDVEIVRLSYINFRNNIDKVKDSKFFLKPINFERHMTIGSIAYNLQKQYVKYVSSEEINFENKIEKGFKIDYDTHQIASNFYFGGLTQFNPKIQNEIVECESGEAYDVNSMYPSSMVQDLPFGSLYNFNDKEPDAPFYEYIEYEIEAAFSKKGNFLCLANWNKIHNNGSFTQNRYVKSMYKFTCFYLKEEFEKLKMFYDFEGVKIKNRWWAYKSNYLKDYVNDFYKFKEEYSIKKEPANALTYKILLNASYGKHATRLDFNELFYTNNENEYKFLLSLGKSIINDKNYKIKEASKNVNLHNHKFLSLESLDIKNGNKYYNKLCAATITALSRIKLYDAVNLLGEEYFLYCDTDSVYVRNNKNRDKIQLHPTKLGLWDVQSQFKYFITKGAKAYAYGDDKSFQKDYKARLSGVNKNWLAKNMGAHLFTENEITLELANLKIESCDSGLILVWKDYESKKRLN